MTTRDGIVDRQEYRLRPGCRVYAGYYPETDEWDLWVIEDEGPAHLFVLDRATFTRHFEPVFTGVPTAPSEAGATMTDPTPRPAAGETDHVCPYDSGACSPESWLCPLCEQDRVTRLTAERDALAAELAACQARCERLRGAVLGAMEAHQRFLHADEQSLEGNMLALFMDGDVERGLGALDSSDLAAPDEIVETSQESTDA